MWNELHTGVITSSRPFRAATFSMPLVQKLISLRQITSGAPEAGGLLIGSLRGNNFEVRFLTTPYPGDEQSRIRFVRRDPTHLAFSDRLSKASHRSVTYLGEWHTHPTDDPVPSAIDRSEWLAAQKRIRGPFLALILGTRSFHLESIG
jgi:integrative and conjugative element protein (TIGR02256 family)